MDRAKPQGAGYQPKIEVQTFELAKKQIENLGKQLTTSEGSREIKHQPNGKQLLSTDIQKSLEEWGRGKGQIKTEKEEIVRIDFQLELDSGKNRQAELEKLNKQEKENTKAVLTKLGALDESLSADIAAMKKDSLSASLSEQRDRVKSLKTKIVNKKDFKADLKYFEDLARSSLALDIFVEDLSKSEGLIREFTQSLRTLANTQAELADLNRGIQLSDQAITILQKAENIQTKNVNQLNEAIDTYSKALEKLMIANDRIRRLEKSKEKGEKDVETDLTIAKAELEVAKDEVQKALKAQSRILKEISKNVDREKIGQKIEELRSRITELKEGKESKPQVSVLGQTLESLQSNLELYESIEQVFLRHSERIDNPSSETRKKEESEAVMAFQAMRDWVQTWGPITDEITSLIKTVQEIPNAAELIEQQPEDMIEPVKINQNNLHELMEATKRLEKIERTYRGVVALEMFKRDIEENMAFFGKLAMWSALTGIGIPLALIAGLFYLVSYVKLELLPVKGLPDEKGPVEIASIDNAPVDRALGELKAWFLKMNKTLKEGQNKLDTPDQQKIVVDESPHILTMKKNLIESLVRKEYSIMRQNRFQKKMTFRSIYINFLLFFIYFSFKNY